ncbi:DUF1120 domain-containing protein [Pseudoxanthomonas sp. UTMC 1351]|uniref:DUF1120 domain-containing protein n=1 Tax=Pseudoxanthomonas sp. UTMC 1351 TaxID=2695853 RepID=UPI0034CFA53E
MNQLSKTALIALIAFASSTATAQESVELTVTGRALPPGACTPTLSSPNLDWGQIPINHEDETTELPMKAIDVGVNCASPISVALYIVDNKHNTLPGSFKPQDGWRGLGLIDGQPISGAYQIKVKDNAGLVDGNSTAAVTRGFTSPAWLTLTSAISPDRFLSFGATGYTAPSPLKSLSFTAEVTGILNPRSLPSGDISLSGSSTFVVYYL